MRESVIRYTTRQAAALALAGGLAIGLYAFQGADLQEARATNEPLQAVVSGAARVIDGDTIEVSGQRIRLEGIDAPETAQHCQRAGGGVWPCGRMATEALEALVRTADVVCHRHGNDRYGRMLGVCFANGLDINAMLVRRGHAWAFVRYSRTYVGVEAEARRQRAGIWQADNQPAWDYRANRWASAEQAAPAGCAIKGNVSRHGRIYHMPWQPWYGRVRIDAERGERWFCDEAEAIKEGWRPAVGG